MRPSTEIAGYEVESEWASWVPWGAATPRGEERRERISQTVKITNEDGLEVARVYFSGAANIRQDWLDSMIGRDARELYREHSQR